MIVTEGFFPLEIIVCFIFASVFEGDKHPIIVSRV